MGKIVKTWTRYGGERERELPEANGKPKRWWVLRIQPNEFGTPDSCGSASLSNREVFSTALSGAATAYSLLWDGIFLCGCSGRTQLYGSWWKGSSEDPPRGLGQGKERGQKETGNLVRKR